MILKLFILRLLKDQEDKDRLLECMDASSEISLFINKAVTECENRKRVEEIQSRMDTKEFDQFCHKSPLLSQYKVGSGCFIILLFFLSGSY